MKTEIIHKLPITKCFVSVLNTRQPLLREVTQLAISLKHTGQTTPGIVRPLKGKPGCYEIAAGARRRVACEAAKLPTFDAIIREMDDTTFGEFIIVENLQREDVSPKAEAALLEQLVAGGVRTAESISARLGKPKYWVERRLQLLKVIPEFRKEWERGDIAHFEVEMMELLGSLPVNTQKSLLGDWKMKRCESRKALRAFLEDGVLCSLGDAPFDLTDKRFFVPGCGPGCASDSSKNGTLYDFVGTKDKEGCGRCLNSVCFNKRLALWRKTEIERLAAGEDLPLVCSTYGTHRLAVGTGEVTVSGGYYNLQSKPTPGAQKVICLDTGKPAIRFVSKPDRGGGGNTGKKLVSEKGRLAARHDLLHAKRWHLVHAELIKALDASAPGDCTADIDNLVAVFGLPYENKPDTWSAKRRDWFSTFDGIKKMGFPFGGTGYNEKPIFFRTRIDAVWHALKIVLKKQIDKGRLVTDITKCLGDMTRVAALIAFPLGARKFAADLAVNAPKGWGPVDPHTLVPLPKSVILKVAKSKTPKIRHLREIDRLAPTAAERKLLKI
jgi:ParB/RepB/Spo0J family partition protein